MNYGFDPKSIVITPDQYSLGGGQLVGNILKEDGQWDEFLPTYEPQAERYETSGCTCWGGQNQLEILHKCLFGIEPNYSERFNYILADITLAGKNPHDTYESFRKDGLIPQELLPITDTYEEFLTPKPMEAKYLVEGQKWLNQYEYKHDWVLSGYDVPQDYRTLTLKEALKYCPLGVSVTAWISEDDVYVDRGIPNNHWCVLYGYNDKGWKVFDSYDHSKKIVSYDHKIMFAKRITLKKGIVKKNWLVDMFKSVVQFMKDIIKIK